MLTLHLNLTKSNSPNAPKIADRNDSNFLNGSNSNFKHSSISLVVLIGALSVFKNNMSGLFISPPVQLKLTIYKL